MADVKISELTALTLPADNDVVPIVDVSANVTKKITLVNLRGTAGSYLHAESHIMDANDEIDGDKLDIDLIPSNYTPIESLESDDVSHLASHLAGIDAKFGESATPADHAPSHITSGTDEIDGDKLDIDWTPVNYTPTVTAQSDNVDHLSSHLSGIDILLGNIQTDSLDFSAGIASDHSAIGITDSVTVDTNTVGFGGALKLSSDGHFDDADSDAAAGMPCSALALAAGTGAGKPILLLGLIRDDSWSWTPGGMVYISGTAGALTQTIPAGVGKFVQIVGIAKTATILFFNPSYVMVERV